MLQDRQGFVQHFIEKPDWEHVVTDLVNTGIYIVSPRAMAYVPEDQPFDFAKDLFPLLLAAHEPILGVPMDATGATSARRAPTTGAVLTCLTGG